MEPERAKSSDNEKEQEAKETEEEEKVTRADEGSNQMDIDQTSALVINTETDAGWKYWCHQCSEILETIPKVRNDGSIECPKCHENVVEQIAEDDEFLQDDIEEKKDNDAPPQARAGRNPFEVMFSNVRQVNGGNQGDVQYFIEGLGNSQGAPPDGEHPFMNHFHVMNGSNGNMGGDFNRVIHQFDRLFMGGAAGSPTNAEQAEQVFQGVNLGNLLQNLVGFGGGPRGSFGGQRLNPSDYGIGFNGLRDILSRLQREGGPNGPPPAAKNVVEKLEEVEFSAENKEQETACAVCKDDFKEGDKVIQFPCPNKHLYHGECIHPWLKLHNSCPVCRFELATDDELYERMKQYRVNISSNNGNNNNNDPNPPAPVG